MLRLTSYFQKLNEQLSHDTRLQDSLRIYLSDAGTDCVRKTEQCITHFQQCRLKQWEHNEELDPAYDRSFNELAYLAMRLERPTLVRMGTTLNFLAI